MVKYRHGRNALVVFLTLSALTVAGLVVKPLIRQDIVNKSSDARLLAGEITVAVGAGTTAGPIATDAFRNGFRGRGYDVRLRLDADVARLTGGFGTTGGIAAAVVSLDDALRHLTDAGTIPLVLERRGAETLVLVVARTLALDTPETVDAFLAAYFETLDRDARFSESGGARRWYSLRENAELLFGAAPGGRFLLVELINEALESNRQNQPEYLPDFTAFQFINSAFIRALYEARGLTPTPAPAVADWSGLAQIAVLEPTIRFRRGRSALEADDAANLAQAMDQFRSHTLSRLLLQTHFDDEAATPLAEARAEAVRSHLIATYGLDPDRIGVAGVRLAPGPDEPLSGFRRRLREVHLVVVDGS